LFFLRRYEGEGKRKGERSGPNKTRWKRRRAPDRRSLPEFSRGEKKKKKTPVQLDLKEDKSRGQVGGGKGRQKMLCTGKGEKEHRASLDREGKKEKRIFVEKASEKKKKRSTDVRSTSRKEKKEKTASVLMRREEKEGKEKDFGASALAY